MLKSFIDLRKLLPEAKRHLTEDFIKRLINAPDLIKAQVIANHVLPYQVLVPVLPKGAHKNWHNQIDFEELKQHSSNEGFQLWFYLLNKDFNQNHYGSAYADLFRNLWSEVLHIRLNPYGFDSSYQNRMGELFPQIPVEDYQLLLMESDSLVLRPDTLKTIEREDLTDVQQIKPNRWRTTTTDGKSYDLYLVDISILGLTHDEEGEMDADLKVMLSDVGSQQWNHHYHWGRIDPLKYENSAAGFYTRKGVLAEYLHSWRQLGLPMWHFDGKGWANAEDRTLRQLEKAEDSDLVIAPAPPYLRQGYNGSVIAGAAMETIVACLRANPEYLFYTPRMRRSNPKQIVVEATPISAKNPTFYQLVEQGRVFIAEQDLLNSSEHLLEMVIQGDLV